MSEQSKKLPAPRRDLPVPRLELVYQQIDEWRHYVVTYRMVYRHLLGDLVGVEMSVTTCGPNLESTDPGSCLPYRDGTHIAHDSAHLSMPAYTIKPGCKPTRLGFADMGYDKPVARGVQHRG